MNRFLFILFFAFLSLPGRAQEAGGTYTLEQCIELAIRNNIGVKQGGLQVALAEVAYKQSRQNLLPNANGTIAHGVNQGRSIDPFTNTYVNQNVHYAAYSAGSNAVLFNGFSLRNSIRQFRYAHDASRLELQQRKDNLTLDVILAYLQVLGNEDLAVGAEQAAAVTRKQVERLEVLHRQGAIPPPLLYDLRGQLKENELALVNAENALASAKLALAQLMNIPFDKGMKLVRMPLEDGLAAATEQPDAIYRNAEESLAVVKAASLRRLAAGAAVKAVRGERYPALFLNGNLNTNYSSAAMKDVFLGSSEVPTSDYVLVNGSKTPVIVQRNNLFSQPIRYGTQLQNNIFSSVGVGLRIPIFNASQTRNRIRLAEIELETVALDEQETRRQLRQDVEQAYLNLNGARQRYRVSGEQVAAYAESFRAAEVRFNAGVGTSVDYLVAKNNLDRASLGLIMARYDYLLRKKIVQFYNGSSR